MPALESSYFLEPGGTATGNVTFYPKVNSLVIGDEAYDRLDDAQRACSRRRRRRRASGRSQEAPTDAEAAEAFCAERTPGRPRERRQLAALEQAAAPVNAELESDEPTASIIEAIRALKRDVAGSVTPSGCGKPARALGRPSSTACTASGSPTRSCTTQASRARPTSTRTTACTRSRCDGGTYCWVQQAPNPLDNPDECSTYEIDGDRVAFSYPSGKPDVYRFTKTANGDLEVAVVKAGEPDALPYLEVWAANTWKRIGDA